MKATLTKKDGRVTLDKPFDYMCSMLRNGVYDVTITRRSRPRSIPQNALMWMWYTALEEYTGQPKEDWHEYYKSRFLQRHIIVKGREVTVVGSTADLTSCQFSEYLEKIKADQAQDGISLPLPSDPFFDMFVSQYRTK